MAKTIKRLTDDRLSLVFHALADPTRRRMLEMLREQELTLSQLAEPFAMTMPAILKHLAVLAEAGIIDHYKTGRVRHCRLEEGPIVDATVWLSQHSKYWQSQFEALATLLNMQSKPEIGVTHELSNKERANSEAARSDQRTARKNPRSAKIARARKSAKL